MNRLAVRTALVMMSLGIGVTSAHSADRVRIVGEGGIRDQWMIAEGVTLAAPGYPAAYAERGDNVCVAVGYAINPDGTTSDFNLLKAWNSADAKEPVEGFYGAFAQTSASALSQWKFQPRPEISNPQRTYTVATMHFMGKQAVDTAQLRAHCHIADLAALVHKNELPAEEPAQSRLRRDLERRLRDVQGRQSLVENPGAAAGRPVY